MFDFLAIKSVLLAFQYPLFFIGAGVIASVAFPPTKTFEPDRGVYYLNQCQHRKWPNVPIKDLSRMPREKQNLCITEALQKAEAEYAQQRK